MNMKIELMLVLVLAFTPVPSSSFELQASTVQPADKCSYSVFSVVGVPIIGKLINFF